MVVARFGELSVLEAKEMHVRHGYGIWKSIQKVKCVLEIHSIQIRLEEKILGG